MGLPALWRSDILAMVMDRGEGRFRYFLAVLTKVWLYPRIQAVLLYRLAHWCYHHRLSIPAYYLQGLGLKRSGAEIHPAAQIGPGFCLMHSSGTVIGDRAKIGAHFQCFQGVTVGESGHGDGMPTLGDWVTASAGVKILGGITLGSHAQIGANAVVLKSVPEYGVAVGIPARVIKINLPDPLRELS